MEKITSRNVIGLSNVADGRLFLMTNTNILQYSANNCFGVYGTDALLGYG